MGGIPDKQVEWAVVNRMKRMLETPRTDFSVTETFALFSSIVMWAKNRAWTSEMDEGERDVAARSVRAGLGKALILDPPWALSRGFSSRNGGEDKSPFLRGQVNKNFEGMTAAQFFKWLRDALAHGDGRTVKPLHRPARDGQTEWLGGFEISFNETKGSKNSLVLTLTKDDMRSLGVGLADAFCAALAGNKNYAQLDLATRVVEASAVKAA